MLEAIHLIPEAMLLPPGSGSSQAAVAATRVDSWGPSSSRRSGIGGEGEVSSRWGLVSGPEFLKLFDHAVEVRVAGAESPRQQVSAAFRDLLSIGNHIELTGLARCDHRFDAEARSDEGHETRDLGLIVLSRWAVNDFDSHPDLPSAGIRRRSCSRLRHYTAIGARAGGGFQEVATVRRGG